MSSKILEQLQQDLAAKQKQVEKIQQSINELLKKTQVTCKGCGVTHEINQLTYIQSHWYVHPYSCTGGDYWNQGEGGWRCPLCRTHHRLYKNPEIEALKRFFKDVENEYKD